MRILIEILHPAHVHFFRNFIREMEARGNRVVVTARDKDVTRALLEAYGIPYRLLSVQRRGVLGLGMELARRTNGLRSVIEEFRPDVLTGIMGPTIALAGRLTGVPAAVFYDTETAWLTNSWVYPLADAVITPSSYPGRVRGTHLTYSGNHDLAYLHPTRFQPDPHKLRLFDLDPSRPFAVARFVAFRATHDIGDRGLEHSGRVAVLRHLASLGEVVVSVEGDYPADLPGRPLKGPPHELHHVLAHAQVVVGDSGSVSSEAATLGTPAVFVSTAKLGVLLHLDHTYGLLKHVHPEVAATIAAIDAMLADLRSGGFRQRRDAFLKAATDVTQWMVAFFETRYGARS